MIIPQRFCHGMLCVVDCVSEALEQARINIHSHIENFEGTGSMRKPMTGVQRKKQRFVLVLMNAKPIARRLPCLGDFYLIEFWWRQPERPGRWIIRHKLLLPALPSLFGYPAASPKAGVGRDGRWFAGKIRDSRFGDAPFISFVRRGHNGHPSICPTTNKAEWVDPTRGR